VLVGGGRKEERGRRGRKGERKKERKEEVRDISVSIRPPYIPPPSLSPSRKLLHQERALGGRKQHTNKPCRKLISSCM